MRDGTRMIATDLSLRLAERAEEAEASLATVLGGTENLEAAGIVRIAATPILAIQLLAPALKMLRKLAPAW